MAHISYEFHPDDPVATENEKIKAYFQYVLGLIVLWGSIGSIIYYICSLVSSIKDKPSDDLLYSILLVLVISVVDYFAFFGKLDKEIKIVIAKKYFLFFFFGAIELSCIVCMITSVNSYTVDDSVFDIAIVVAILFLILFIICFISINKIKLPKIRLFTDEEKLNRDILKQESEVNVLKLEPSNTKEHIDCSKSEQEYIFCHKCGRKLTSDSQFCNFCGTCLN